jgi:hypothetical protein
MKQRCEESVIEGNEKVEFAFGSSETVNDIKVLKSETGKVEGIIILTTEQTLTLGNTPQDKVQSTLANNNS